MMTRNPYYLLGVPLLLLGLGIAGWALERGWKSRASRGWPMTAGTVGWVDVDESRSIDGDTTYTPRIEFQYMVEGFQYSSDNYTFAKRSTTDGGFARALADSYQQRGTVDVFYNPRKPTEAVLQPGDEGGLSRDLITGIVFLGIGLFTIGRGVWRGRMGGRRV